MWHEIRFEGIRYVLQIGNNLEDVECLSVDTGENHEEPQSECTVNQPIMVVP